MFQISHELLVGLTIAALGAVGTWITAKANFRASKQADLTARYDLLLDNQGKEIARLATEVKELRGEFRKEQELTQTLREESNKWRELLKLALSHLRVLQEWRAKGHPPPPPEMPLVLDRLRLEDL